MKIHAAWSEWEGAPGIFVPLCSPGFRRTKAITLNKDKVTCQSCLNLLNKYWL